MVEVSEPGVYPAKWSEFRGQEIAKEQLRKAARSARIRKAAMEHTLIVGDTGGGKTALARLVAAEIRMPILEISGMVPISTARRTWTELPPRSVIWWDEFHRAVEGGRKNVEWLLHYLQDGELKGPFGPEPMPAATILAATNRPDLLPPTIRNRMNRVRLGPYSTAEAAGIAGLMSRRVLEVEGLPALSRDNALTVATISHCNPRAVLRNLLTLRDIALTTKNVARDNGYVLDELFRLTGVTPDGLDVLAQLYLLVLLREFPEGAGIATLKDRLMEPSLSVTEHVLVQMGYVGKTRGGRTLTAAGMARAKLLDRAA